MGTNAGCPDCYREEIEAAWHKRWSPILVTGEEGLSPRGHGLPKRQAPQTWTR